jgi:hypothetical protein
MSVSIIDLFEMVYIEKNERDQLLEPDAARQSYNTVKMMAVPGPCQAVGGAEFLEIGDLFVQRIQFPP